MDREQSSNDGRSCSLFEDRGRRLLSPTREATVEEIDSVKVEQAHVPLRKCWWAALVGVGLWAIAFTSAIFVNRDSTVIPPATWMLSAVALLVALAGSLVFVARAVLRRRLMEVIPFLVGALVFSGFFSVSTHFRGAIQLALAKAALEREVSGGAASAYGPGRRPRLELDSGKDSFRSLEFDSTDWLAPGPSDLEKTWTDKYGCKRFSHRYAGHYYIVRTVCPD